MPIDSYVGSSPMIPVDSPITSVVMMSVARRPMRSPMWPNRMPPSGRNTKPNPNVRNAVSVPTAGSACGKNSWPNTSAAAVP
jgi:hypothetical protein